MQRWPVPDALKPVKPLGDFSPESEFERIFKLVPRLKVPDENEVLTPDDEIIPRSRYGA